MEEKKEEGGIGVYYTAQTHERIALLFSTSLLKEPLRGWQLWRVVRGKYLSWALRKSFYRSNPAERSEVFIATPRKRNRISSGEGDFSLASRKDLGLLQ